MRIVLFTVVVYAVFFAVRILCKLKVNLKLFETFHERLKSKYDYQSIDCTCKARAGCRAGARSTCFSFFVINLMICASDLLNFVFILHKI